MRSEDLFLIDRLIAPPILHLRGTIRREDNEGNVRIASFNHRWKKIRHSGARGGDDAGGFAGCLSGTERKESKPSLVKVGDKVRSENIECLQRKNR
jgi:hypothetical protein